MDEIDERNSIEQKIFDHTYKEARTMNFLHQSACKNLIDPSFTSPADYEKRTKDLKLAATFIAASRQALK